ncbi:MAG: acyl--CoA ligase [Lachnospiraceae bacterium]|nr:acyl--CoA ligase [Lachnospiraceae bacterium]
MDYLVNRVYEIASKHPNKEAVIFKNETLTYRDLCLKMEAIASFLDEKKVEKKSNICFLAVSKPEMVVGYLGILLYGSVAVYLDKNGTEESINHIFKETEGKLLFSDKKFDFLQDSDKAYSLKAVLSEYEENELVHPSYSPKEDEVCEMLFTTGTTSKPKGVVHTYSSIDSIIQNTIRGANVTEDVRMLLPLPLHHSFALRVLRAVLYQGGTLVLQNGFTIAKNLEENILLHKCNAMACVPASYEVIKSQMKDKFRDVFSQLNYIEFGAGSLNRKQRLEITNLLPNVLILNTWGSSETGGVIFGNVNELVKDETTISALGKVVSDTEIRIKNDRMCLSGKMLMKEYFHNEALTKETILEEDHKRWLLTGDSISIDEKGYIFMQGRADDIINVGGEKVSPVEVVEVASLYEGIKECACAGVNDDLMGQAPVLFVVKKSGYEEEELIRFLSKKLERFKLPAAYIYLDELPRNTMAKIDKKQLLKNYYQKEEGQIIQRKESVIHYI